MIFIGKLLLGLARKKRTSLLDQKGKTLLVYRMLEVDIRRRQ
jgi:hypothetical protein